MLEPPSIGLRIVGPEELEEPFRACLRPGETVLDGSGTERRLPSYFFEVPSWEAALEVRLAPNFGLWELIDVDVRECEAMRSFPRYVPCALAILAGYLQLLRGTLGRVVRVAANGGYRSPGHRLSAPPSTHCWGAAANIYRLGDDWLESTEVAQRYVDIARNALPAAWVRPIGDRPGQTFDHLHIDLGYLLVEPHRALPTTGSSEG